MKFLIDRASLGADDVKPCEGAINLDPMKIIDETGFPIIVYGQGHNYKGSLPFLSIYDDYIE